jgi:predicted nucleotidyltransferase
MIPDFYDGVFLPEGEHEATWDEIDVRFGQSSDQRKSLSARLKQFLDIAQGCQFIKVYIFGSFTSAKPKEPSDIDLLWVYREGLNLDSLSFECRQLLNYTAMKEREKWDMFCCSDDPFCVTYMLSGWRKDKNAERTPRGMVLIHLR